jgi:hypothetical protein
MSNTDKEEQDAPRCASNGQHRDDGRGFCIDCGNAIPNAPVVSITAVRANKKAAAVPASPQIFKPGVVAQRDFQEMHGGLAALSGMVRSGLISNPETISALILAYSHHARIAEMKADKTLHRAAVAERLVRKLERQARKAAKG